LANFNEDDTQTFFSTYLPSLLGETCGMVYGTNNGDTKPSVEANLDVQLFLYFSKYSFRYEPHTPYRYTSIS